MKLDTKQNILLLYIEIILHLLHYQKNLFLLVVDTFPLMTDDDEGNVRRKQ